MYGTCMVHVWYMYGTCMVHVWYMYGTCMAHVWYMYGICMVHVWSMYGPCMVHVWSMYGSFKLIVRPKSPPPQDLIGIEPGMIVDAMLVSVSVARGEMIRKRLSKQKAEGEH